MRRCLILCLCLLLPLKALAAVVGGAKVSSKLDVLTHLVARVDHLIIGGGMANTFLYAQSGEEREQPGALERTLHATSPHYHITYTVTMPNGDAFTGEDAPVPGVVALMRY